MFTSYMIESQLIWLRCKRIADGRITWVRFADIERVTVSSIVEGGNIVVRTKSEDLDVPHKCKNQNDLDIAVFKLLEHATK